MSPRGRAPSKYRNVRAEVDGITFHSKAESRRWLELKLLERAGAVRNITRQAIYPLVVRGIHVCTYRSDFNYEEAEPSGATLNGREVIAWMPVVEDVKGVRTKDYIIKKALMLACHGIAIRETGRTRR